MRACPSCGRDNPDDGRFCSECGAALGAPGRREESNAALREAATLHERKGNVAAAATVHAKSADPPVGA